MFNYYQRLFVAFWKDFAKPFWEQVVLGLIIAVAILYFQIRYGVIKSAEQKGNELALLWPYLGLIGAFLSFHLLRAPWKLDQEHSRKHEEHSRQLAEKHGELQKEIANRARPEVGVTCDWKLDRSTNISIPYHPKALVLKTLTGVAAFDVEIQEIKQAKGTAKFKIVSRLDGNTEVTPICMIERGNAVYATWDLHSLVEQSAQGMGLKMSEIAIPIIVDYKDSYGTPWQGVYELRYDPFLDVAQAHLQGFRRKL